MVWNKNVLPNKEEFEEYFLNHTNKECAEKFCGNNSKTKEKTSTAPSPYFTIFPSITLLKTE